MSDGEASPERNKKTQIPLAMRKGLAHISGKLALTLAHNKKQMKRQNTDWTTDPHGVAPMPNLREEIRKLRRQGCDLLYIARQMLAIKGVIDHWPLFFRHGVIGNSRNFQLPLP